MARVVLHIGTHKTGSTTFQDMLAHNAGRLAGAGIIYPRIVKASGHHGIVGDWHPALDGAYRWPQGSLGTLRDLAARHAAGDGVVILSSEELSRAEGGRRPDMAAILDALAPFSRVDVVCVLREQWQFLQSVWLEVSRRRTPMPVRWMANGAMGTDLAEGLWVDYNRLYDDLLRVLPPEHIRFVDFDAARRSEGGIVGAILEAGGIAAPAMDVVHGGHSNPSPPPLPRWMAARIADPKPAGPGLVDVLAQALAAHFGPDRRSCLFTREEVERLHGHFARRNARLTERLRAVQPDFALPATTPPEGTVFRDDLDEAAWLACLRAVHQAKRS